MAINFGTSGIRGLETDLTDDLCYRFARAFLRHFAVQPDAMGAAAVKQCIIAGDLRRSTPRIMAALASGIQAEGFEVLDAGVIPTPALAFECIKRGVPGIMVTGSHIPADRNGIKFYFPWGEILKADEAPILELERILQGKVLRPNQPPAERKPIQVAESYVSRFVDYFGKDALSGCKVVFYEHSSAAREIYPAVLEGMGAEVIRMGRSEEFIPVDTEAVESLRALGSEVTSRGAFALISTDGDGDRPLLIDEKGQMIRGDQIGIIAARELEADSVTTPLSSSTALELSGWFRNVRRCKIGSPFVVAEMETVKREGARRIVGFEANGGFLTGSDMISPTGVSLSALPTRDCVLPALLVLVAAQKKQASVSQVIAELPPRFVVSDLIREFPVEQSRAVLSKLLSGAAALFDRKWKDSLGACSDINSMDGVRASFAGGDIIHLRPSGNAPEFRIYVESESEERAGRLVQVVRRWVSGELVA
ncbi:MAG: hypothetical protein A2X94_03915 [Bdellovibrionales bacterium GWB1_55_8]|nr:MAG: hypothetical protein A2X94_03915 [Bdellovibrionales bacterium GWB1_55_8]